MTPLLGREIRSLNGMLFAINNFDTQGFSESLRRNGLTPSSYGNIHSLLEENIRSEKFLIERLGPSNLGGTKIAGYGLSRLKMAYWLAYHRNQRSIGDVINWISYVAAEEWIERALHELTANKQETPFHMQMIRTMADVPLKSFQNADIMSLIDNTAKKLVGHMMFNRIGKHGIWLGDELYSVGGLLGDRQNDKLNAFGTFMQFVSNSIGHCWARGAPLLMGENEIRVRVGIVGAGSVGKSTLLRIVHELGFNSGLFDQKRSTYTGTQSALKSTTFLDFNTIYIPEIILNLP